MNAMRFRAKYVSASGNGDYYQVAFDNRDAASDATDVHGPASPYLLIQRQFEDPRRCQKMIIKSLQDAEKHSRSPSTKLRTNGDRLISLKFFRSC